MSNAINWFELPASNFERAVKFYGEILGAELQIVEFQGTKMGFFPTKDNGVGGCVLETNEVKPSMEGALVYLNGGEDLNNHLNKVEAAGGKVLVPKMDIGDNGFFGVFQDTEGNRVAFHSMN